MSKTDLRKQKKKAKRAVRRANQLEAYRPGKYLSPQDLMRRYYGSGMSYSGMSGGGGSGTPGIGSLVGEVAKIGGLLNSLLQSNKNPPNILGNMGVNPPANPVPPPVPPVVAPDPPIVPPRGGGGMGNIGRPPATPVENALVPFTGRRRRADDQAEPVNTQRQRTERNIVDGVNRMMEEGIRRNVTTRQRPANTLLQIAGPQTLLIEPPPSSDPAPPHSNTAPGLLAITNGEDLEEERPIIQSDFTRRDLELDDDDEGIVVQAPPAPIILEEPVVTTSMPAEVTVDGGGDGLLDQIGEDTTLMGGGDVIPRQVEVYMPSNVSVLTEPVDMDNVEDDTTSISPDRESIYRKNIARGYLHTRQHPSLDGPRNSSYSYLTPESPSDTQILSTIYNARRKIDDLVAATDLITVPGNVVKKKNPLTSRSSILEKMGVDSLPEGTPSRFEPAAEEIASNKHSTERRIKKSQEKRAGVRKQMIQQKRGIFTEQRALENAAPATTLEDDLDGNWE